MISPAADSPSRAGPGHTHIRHGPRPTESNVQFRTCKAEKSSEATATRPKVCSLFSSHIRIATPLRTRRTRRTRRRMAAALKRTALRIGMIPADGIGREVLPVREA
jgi:hypothetical protein